MRFIPDRIISNASVLRARKIQQLKNKRQVWTAVWNDPVPYKHRIQRIRYTLRHLRAVDSAPRINSYITPFNVTIFITRRIRSRAIRYYIKQITAIERYFQRHVLSELLVRTHPVKIEYIPGISNN